MPFEYSPEKYSAQWPTLYKQEAAAIFEKCSGRIIRIEHIGSTSLPGMLAKPILDILVEVNAGDLKSITSQMEKLNYTSKGEHGIAGRSYFSKSIVDSPLAYHVHCFEEENPEIEKHLAFRKYLLSHRNIFDQYLELKEAILLNTKVTRRSYQDLKNEFLRKITQEALVWNANRIKNEKPVQKVVIYALRRRNDILEVLVFDHVKFMEVSPQLPSGTVETDEDIKISAKRELLEESGILPKEDISYLGSYVFYKHFNDQFQERYIFALCDDSIPEKWTHAVTGEGDDQNLEFRYYWLPVSVAKDKLQANLGDGLLFFAEDIGKLI